MAEDVFLGAWSTLLKWTSNHGVGPVHFGQAFPLGVREYALEVGLSSWGRAYCVCVEGVSSLRSLCP